MSEKKSNEPTRAPEVLDTGKQSSPMTIDEKNILLSQYNMILAARIAESVIDQTRDRKKALLEEQWEVMDLIYSLEFGTDHVPQSMLTAAKMTVDMSNTAKWRLAFYNALKKDKKE